MEYNIIIYFSLTFNINKRQRIPQRQSIMDNPEKLATQGTQDEDKTKQKHNTICVGHYYMYMQTNTNNINKTQVLLPPTNNWR